MTTENNDTPTAFQNLAATFARLETPHEEQIIAVMAEALEAHADWLAQNLGELADAELALIQAAEEFLALYKDTEAYDFAGLGGSTFDDLLNNAGGQDD